VGGAGVAPSAHLPVRRLSPAKTASNRAGRGNIGAVQQDRDAGVTFRIGLFGALLPLLFGCAGPVDEVSTIPAEEAAWQAIMPRFAGMPVAEVEHCAGPPRGVTTAPGGDATLVYRSQDLKNYCEVRLLVRGGRVLSFAADYAAPEFLGLRDGSNYCGHIFQSCLR
jgi:hypothetical protein